MLFESSTARTAVARRVRRRRSVGARDGDQFEEFAKVGAPTGGPNDVFNIGMIGNTILHWGTPEQKSHYIPQAAATSTSGARATASRTPAPTWRVSDCGRARRRRVGASTARRSGRPTGTSPTTSSWSVGPTPPPAPTTASRSCWSPMDQPGIEVRPDQDDVGRQRVQRGVLHRRPLPQGRTCWARSARAGPSR
jgi:alkylation response protein AidB-like acyl-CoA dehydrogenase